MEKPIPDIKSDLSNILGQKVFAGKESSIYRNGIADDRYYILWPNVERVYVGGTTKSINGIQTSENRELSINDSKYEVSFSSYSFFRMNHESKQTFNNIYAFVLNNIFPRQWSQFLQKINNGEWLSFNKFEVTKEAFYFRKMFGKYDKIETNCILGCDIKIGFLYVQYQDPKKKLKEKCAGRVLDIPNIYLIQTYINKVIADKTKPQISKF